MSQDTVFVTLTLEFTAAVRRGDNKDPRVAAFFKLAADEGLTLGLLSKRAIYPSFYLCGENVLNEDVLAAVRALPDVVSIDIPPQQRR